MTSKSVKALSELIFEQQLPSRPQNWPKSMNFSSGPCKKRPGYSLEYLNTDCLGRSHRSKLGKARLFQAIQETKEILDIPKDYRVGIVPASDTGAMEMVMWSMLGAKPVDVCYWESFGAEWKNDIKNQLKIKDVTEHSAPYGQLPDLTKTNSNHDIVFTFNGTTSGVRVPDLDWISSERQGITFNDATSALFGMYVDWSKCDVTTFSWQKALGGEGGHGMVVLSPRAVERLTSFTPPRPLPKIFRMVKKGKLDESIFEGSTINTPSMLCVEDYLDALKWTSDIGGLDTLIKKSQDNLKVISDFVDRNEWIHFLAEKQDIISNTSVCLKLDLPAEKVKELTKLLQKEKVAHDIDAYRDAPSGIRIWCGCTVDKSDVEILCEWIEWAYTNLK